MARQPRYEDYVSYDAEPLEEPCDETRDPNSGRLWSELAAEARAKRATETPDGWLRVAADIAGA